MGGKRISSLLHSSQRTRRTQLVCVLLAESGHYRSCRLLPDNCRWLTHITMCKSCHNGIFTELPVIYGHPIDVVQLEYYSKAYYKSRLPLRKRNIYIGQTFGIINQKLSNPFKTVSMGTSRHLRRRCSWGLTLIYIPRKLARNQDKKSSWRS